MIKRKMSCRRPEVRRKMGRRRRRTEKVLFIRGLWKTEEEEKEED